MINPMYSRILLRQEGDPNGGEGGTPQFDFDIEKVKASGLFVPKEEFEKVQSTWNKKVKQAEDNGYKLLGSKFDEISSEIETYTGVSRLEIENEGKKEREKLADYVKRVLAAKQTEPLEKEKQLRDTFSKKEQSYKQELENYQKKLLDLQYTNEYEAAKAKVLGGFQDEKAFEKAEVIVKSILAAHYGNKEFSQDYGRFVYKDSQGEVVLNKNGEPMTTKELLAEVAKTYLPTIQQDTPKGLGVKGANNNKSIVTKDDIHALLAKEGLVAGTREYTVKYGELLKQHGLL